MLKNSSNGFVDWSYLSIDLPQMKNYINYILVLIIACGCTYPVKGTVYFIVESDFDVNFTLTSIVHPAGIEEVVHTKTLKQGTNEFAVTITPRKFYHLQIGERSSFVFLEDQNVYTLNDDLHFFGNGHINNVIQDLQQIFTTTRYNNKVYHEWDNADFTEGIKILRTRMDSVVTHNLPKIPAKNHTALKAYAKYDLLNFTLNKYWSTFNPTKPSTPELRAFLKKDYDSFEINDQLIHLNLYSYKECLQFYQYIAGSATSNNLIKNQVTDMGIFLDALYTNINQATYPPKVKEHIFSNLLFDFLITPPPPNFADKLESFISEYPNSPYYEAILERYKDYQILVNSSNSPYPLYVDNPTNEKLDILEKNKGKLIYIDFWATWCGPCIKELPKLVMLEKNYSDNDQIEIIKVSIDLDKEKWKAFEERKHTNNNIQSYLLEIDENETIRKKYALAAVPKHIIVSPSGKIIDFNAPSPSDPKLKELLDELLKEE